MSNVVVKCNYNLIVLFWNNIIYRELCADIVRGSGQAQHRGRQDGEAPQPGHVRGAADQRRRGARERARGRGRGARARDEHRARAVPAPGPRRGLLPPPRVGRHGAGRGAAVSAGQRHGQGG